MPLGFLIFFVVMYGGAGEKLDKEYKYTLSVNPLAFTILVDHFVLPVPSPGINFERKISGRLSLNFEVNNLLLIFPNELEIGLREYLMKEFNGLYLYQGLAWGWINSFVDTERYGEIAKYIPNLIFTFGYKYVSRGGFTVDPFLVLRSIYGVKGLGGGPIGILPALGIYFGYTW
jgi:hypothetical protein